MGGGQRRTRDTRILRNEELVKAENETRLHGLVTDRCSAEDRHGAHSFTRYKTKGRGQIPAIPKTSKAFSMSPSAFILIKTVAKTPSVLTSAPIR